MAIDRKYGRITTQFGNIGEDEPVVVFRAQDKLLPALLAFYHYLCAKAGSPRRHLDIIMDTREVVQGWQHVNSLRTRVPNSESSRGRL